MSHQGFGARIRQAILDRGAQLGQRYTNVQFGIDVGMAERGRAWSTQAVSEWIAERNEPSISTFRAMAAVTGKDTAWLMALDLERKVAETPAPYYGKAPAQDRPVTKKAAAKKPRRTG